MTLKTCTVLTTVCQFIGLAFLYQCSAAQETLEVQDDSKSPEAYQPQFSEAETVEWEFGVKLSCSGGQAERVQASVPIPMDWPEQEVELYEETKSNNIGKLNTKKLSNGAKILVFTVPRMNNGNYAEGILRFRVKRRSYLLPGDTFQFSFADKLTGKMKQYLKPSPYIESRSKKIRLIGESIAKESADQSAWEQVEAIYSWVRENVEYRFDPKIRTCAEALSKGHGDCEELSSLFIAICRSRGIPARAVFVPGHTYPEFYLVDESGAGHWFPCQIAGARHEFGEISDDRPIMQKGDRFRVPLSRKERRYVQAEARADHATGVLKLDEWIMKKVEP